MYIFYMVSQRELRITSKLVVISGTRCRPQSYIPTQSMIKVILVHKSKPRVKTMIRNGRFMYKMYMYIANVHGFPI